MCVFAKFVRIPSSNNVPGARLDAVTWIDSQNNLWLFGGDCNYGYLNDLWKFDGTYWTWISGSNSTDQPGVYGTKGIPSPNNIPGARGDYAVSWIDSHDNLWLFGGFGIDGSLNDLWKFDGTYWTWISGSNSTYQAGVYGTKGIPSSNNVPGARGYTISWIDSHDNLWLFGGFGIDDDGNYDDLNDLWKFDGTYWTWISGSNSTDQPGVYGTKGITSPDNLPGARKDAISWIDSHDNLWLFGGYGVTIDGYDLLNDLWKFDGTDWTWISGSNSTDQPGVYGTIGIASPDNVPGARGYAISWIDSHDNLWLFGGYGIDDSGDYFDFNDLWKFAIGTTGNSGASKHVEQGIN
jgi:N-acetylneuraminic acid mutarotase